MVKYLIASGLWGNRRQMSEKMIDDAALAMFRVLMKSRGTAKPAADAQWRAMGPEGRKEWRDMAKAAHRVFVDETPAKAAPKPATAPKPAALRW